MNVIYSLLRVAILVAIVMYALHRNTEISERMGCLKTIRELQLVNNLNVSDEMTITRVCKMVLKQ